MRHDGPIGWHESAVTSPSRAHGRVNHVGFWCGRLHPWSQACGAFVARSRRVETFVTAIYLPLFAADLSVSLMT